MARAKTTGMITNRKHLHIALTSCAIAISIAWAPALAAQGRQARRAVATPAVTSEVRVEPARSVLRNLVGRWRVEVRFAGNFDGAPDASGTRVVTTLFDDLRLQWTEALDSSRVKSQGMIGFDARTGQFYSTAVDSTGSGAEMLTGTLDVAEPTITFNAAFVLRMVDGDHFTWAPLDRSWRAVLTREP